MKSSRFSSALNSFKYISKSPSIKTSKMSAINDKTRLIVSAAGIFISYSVFGVLQEKITRGRYGDELNEDGTTGERFTFTLALVGVQCFFNWLFAKGKSIIIQLFSSLQPRHLKFVTTMLPFQLFLSQNLSPRMQHIPDIMRAVLSHIC